MKITALSIVDHPRPWRTGDVLIAFFSCEFSGLRLVDCQLARDGRTGELIPIPPKGENRRGERAITFAGRETRKIMADAAYEAYCKMGGDQ